MRPWLFFESELRSKRGSLQSFFDRFETIGGVAFGADEVVAAFFDDDAQGGFFVVERIGGIERSEIDRSDRDVPRRGTAGGRDQRRAFSRRTCGEASRARASLTSLSSFFPVAGIMATGRQEPLFIVANPGWAEAPNSAAMMEEKRRIANDKIEFRVELDFKSADMLEKKLVERFSEMEKNGSIPNFLYPDIKNKNKSLSQFSL
jgi:hypothetical protein